MPLRVGDIAMIRSATLNDIYYLMEIEKLCFAAGDRFTKKQFQYPIVSIGKGVIDVYCNDKNTPIGYIYSLNNGRIYSLGVLPTFRRMKIASKLLVNAETIWEPIGKMYLEVAKDNRKAIHFYTKHGYKYDGIKHNYYSGGKDAIIMKKELGNAPRRLEESSNPI